MPSPQNYALLYVYANSTRRDGPSDLIKLRLLMFGVFSLAISVNKSYNLPMGSKYSARGIINTTPDDNYRLGIWNHDSCNFESYLKSNFTFDNIIRNA